jgi:hypothetical protein
VEPVVIVALLAAGGFVVFNMFKQRSRRMKEAAASSSTAPATGLSVSRDLFGAGVGHHAPLESFHVVGDEARVTFAVPLPDEEDEVLNDLLLGEAIEVLREKRQTLPIDDVRQVVVFAGRGEVREVARHRLPAPGELPPPILEAGLSFTQIAHDPFAAHFDEGNRSGGIDFGVSATVPEDDLPPLRDELRIPKGLDRGLRALGADPDALDGPEFVIALLRMLGYGVTEQAYDGSYMAVKDGISTYIETDGFDRGEHPELEESVIRRFLANFGSSSADRGLLITDKYGPFFIHEIEANQPKIRFITRERAQGFIDSMALG